MTKRMTDDERLDAREIARFKADDKFLSREERRSAEAEKLVGELMREGQTVHYINLLDRNGRFTGKTKEFAGFHGWSQAIGYLMRNRYV